MTASGLEPLELHRLDRPGSGGWSKARDDQIRGQIPDGAGPDVGHRRTDFALEQVERALETRFATRGKRPEHQLADANGVRAHGERLDDIRAAHKAAVDDDLGAAIH